MAAEERIIVSASTRGVKQAISEVDRLRRATERAAAARDRAAQQPRDARGRFVSRRDGWPDTVTRSYLKAANATERFSRQEMGFLRNRSNIVTRATANADKYNAAQKRIHAQRVKNAEAISGLNKATERNSSLVGSLTRRFLIFHAALATGNALINGIKGSVMEASDEFEAWTRNIELFGGKRARDLKIFSEQATRVIGLSRTAYQEQVGNLGAFLQSAGNDMETSFKVAVDLTKRIGDLASFYNDDLDKVAASMKSILSGASARPGYRYGIDITVNTLRQFMKTLPEFAERTWDTLNLGEKQLIRYHKIMRDTEKAAGDFVRTSDGFANSLRTAGSNAKNVGLAIGNALMPAAKGFVRFWNRFFTDTFQENSAEMAQTLERNRRELSEILDLPKSDGLVELRALWKTISEEKVTVENASAFADAVSRIASDFDKINTSKAVIRGLLRDFKDVNLDDLTISSRVREDLEGASGLTKRLLGGVTDLGGTVGLWDSTTVNEYNKALEEVKNTYENLNVLLQHADAEYASSMKTLVDFREAMERLGISTELSTEIYLGHKKAIEEGRTEYEKAAEAAEQAIDSMRTNMGFLSDAQQESIKNYKSEAQIIRETYSELDNMIFYLGSERDARSQTAREINSRIQKVMEERASVLELKNAIAELESAYRGTIGQSVNNFFAQGNIEQSVDPNSPLGRELGLTSRAWNREATSRWVEATWGGSDSGGGSSGGTISFGGPASENWGAGFHGEVRLWVASNGTERKTYVYDEAAQRWREENIDDYSSANEAAKLREARILQSKLNNLSANPNITANQRSYLRSTSGGITNFLDTASLGGFTETEFNNEFEKVQSNVNRIMQEILDAVKNRAESDKRIAEAAAEAALLYLEEVAELAESDAEEARKKYAEAVKSSEAAAKKLANAEEAYAEAVEKAKEEYLENLAKQRATEERIRKSLIQQHEEREARLAEMFRDPNMLLTGLGGLLSSGDLPSGTRVHTALASKNLKDIMEDIDKGILVGNEATRALSQAMRQAEAARDLAFATQLKISEDQKKIQEDSANTQKEQVNLLKVLVKATAGSSNSLEAIAAGMGGGGVHRIGAHPDGSPIYDLDFDNFLANKYLNDGTWNAEDAIRKARKSGSGISESEVERIREAFGNITLVVDGQEFTTFIEDRVANGGRD